MNGYTEPGLCEHGEVPSLCVPCGLAMARAEENQQHQNYDGPDWKEPAVRAECIRRGMRPAASQGIADMRGMLMDYDEAKRREGEKAERDQEIFDNSFPGQLHKLGEELKKLGMELKAALKKTLNEIGILTGASDPDGRPRPPPLSAADVAVEEDGDEIFTAMPTFCSHWPCKQEKIALRVEEGFWRCPKCGKSYGQAEPNEEPADANQD
jgi:hypothetical protein